MPNMVLHLVVEEEQQQLHLSSLLNVNSLGLKEVTVMRILFWQRRE